MFLHDTANTTENMQNFLDDVWDVVVGNKYSGYTKNTKDRPYVVAKKGGSDNSSARTDRFTNLVKKKNGDGSYCLDPAVYYAGESFAGDLPNPTDYGLTAVASKDSAWETFNPSNAGWDLAFNTSQNAGASQWDDQSGNNSHSPITGNVTVINDELNGHPVYRMNGGYFTNSTAIDTNTETIIIVCKWRTFNENNFHNAIFGVQGAPNAFGAGKTENDESYPLWYVTAATNGHKYASRFHNDFDLGRWVTYRIKRVGEDIEIWENGNLISHGKTGNATNVAGAGIWIGRDNWGHTFKGDMAAFYHKHGEVSNNLCEATERNLLRTFQHYRTPKGLETYTVGAQRYFHKNNYTSLRQMPAKQKLHVLCGQSNAEGWESPYVADLPAHLKTVQDDVLIYYNQEFQPMEAGVNTQAIDTVFHGTEIGIGRGIADAEGICYLVKYTKGGTSINTEWEPDVSYAKYPDDGYLFWGMQDRLDEAINKAGNDLGVSLIVDTFYWYQGESDMSSLENGQAYEAKQISMFNKIKNAYNRYMTFVVVQIVWNPSLAGHDAVRAAKVSHAASDDKVVLIDDWTEKTGSGHINSAEQLEVGRLAAIAALAD